MPRRSLRSVLARLLTPRRGRPATTAAAPHPLPDTLEGPQPPGEPFQWPHTYTLTALEPTTIALPAALVPPDQPISSALRGDDELEIGHDPSRPHLILVRLRPGMSLGIARSCEAVILSDDPRPVQLRMTRRRDS